MLSCSSFPVICVPHYASNEWDCVIPVELICNEIAHYFHLCGCICEELKAKHNAYDLHIGKELIKDCPESVGQNIILIHFKMKFTSNEIHQSIQHKASNISGDHRAVVEALDKIERANAVQKELLAALSRFTDIDWEKKFETSRHK